MIADPEIPRLVTMAGAAALLGKSRQWVGWMVHDRQELPAIKVGGTTLLRESVVLAYKGGADVVSHLIRSEVE